MKHIPDPRAPLAVELVAQRLAAMPPAQLDALERAIDACLDYAAALMGWMRELVRWEFARRGAKPASAALPRLPAADAGAASLTLTVLAALFQSSVDAGMDLRATVNLLEAIRQMLVAYAIDGSTAH